MADPDNRLYFGEQTIITFYNCTQKAIADSPVEAKVTWAHIKTTMAPLLQKVLAFSRVVPRLLSPDPDTKYRSTLRSFCFRCLCLST